MCALFRDRKPDNKNGNPAGTTSRRKGAAAEFKPTAMWPLIDGLQSGRVWSLR